VSGTQDAGRSLIVPRISFFRLYELRPMPWF